MPSAEVDSESAVGSYRDLARSHTLLRREASVQVISGLLFPIVSASIPIIRNVSSLCCPWVYTDAKLSTVAVRDMHIRYELLHDSSTTLNIWTIHSASIKNTNICLHRPTLRVSLWKTEAKVCPSAKRISVQEDHRGL